MVGYNGVSSAWLLMQHADTDPAFQARWLPVIAKRARSGDLSMQQYAFLTDRVLWHQGKKQLFGTQITSDNGQFTPEPLADEAHLDQRRKSIGLMPIADYLCLIRVMVPQPGNSQHDR
jgi:hypothetical protein